MDQNLLTADLSVLHDAEIDLLQIDRAAHEVRLGVITVEQDALTIVFHGVVTMRADNVQYQNVIASIVSSDQGRTPPDALERIARWICSGNTDALVVSEQNMQRHLARIRAGDLHLYYIDPSWGAEIGIIAEGSRMLDRHG